MQGKCRKNDPLSLLFPHTPAFYPRKDFIRLVMERCGVTERTVRNWCIYGMNPQNKIRIAVLVELAGIRFLMINDS